MMRVAYLTDLLNAVGGGGSNANRLCIHFDEQDDIDLTAVHAPGTGAPENFWSAKTAYLTLFPMTLRDGLDELDPDLVFVHSFNPGMMAYLEEYKEEHPEKIIVYRAGINTLEQWLTLGRSGDVNRVTSPIGGLDFFDGIFAPSYAAAERIKLNYGDAAPHLAVAPCTVEYSQYVPTPFMDDGSLRVVMASRIAENNYALGPLLAVRRLSENLDIEMKILSSGQPAYIRAIQSVAEEVDGVEIVGHVDYDDVTDYLNWGDVVCVPSVSQQAVPTIAIEAMAAGNVVLSTTYQAVQEEETIIRVPLDHPPAWYDALEDIAESPDEANERIRQGLDKAMEYDTGYVVEQSYKPMFELLRAEKEMDAE